jgi:hypothetical protein
MLQIMVRGMLYSICYQKELMWMYDVQYTKQVLILKGSVIRYITSDSLL